MELNIALNANELALYKETRKMYAEQAREVANISQCMKDDVTSLLDKLGWTNKTHKSEIKALKKSLKMYVKDSMSEEEAVTSEAAVLARV